MKIVDATWEKANLGIDAKEITFEHTSQIEDLRRALIELADFRGLVTVLVSAGKYNNATCLLEESQYHFSETMLECGFVFSKEHFAQAQRQAARLEGYIRRPVTTQTEVDRIRAEIQKGIFTKERFAKSPYFGVAIANQRMANWLKNWFLEKEDFELFEVLNTKRNSNTPLGFAANYGTGTTWNGFLLGRYAGCIDPLVGFAASYLSIESAYKKNQYHRFKTRYSSNNMSALRMAQQMGILVEKAWYVYTRVYV